MDNVERLLTSALRCFTVNVEWKRLFVVFFKIFSIFPRKRRFVFKFRRIVTIGISFSFSFLMQSQYMRYKMKIVPANISKINDQFNSPYPVVI